MKLDPYLPMEIRDRGPGFLKDHLSNGWPPPPWERFLVVQLWRGWEKICNSEIEKEIALESFLKQMLQEKGGQGPTVRKQTVWSLVKLRGMLRSFGLEVNSSPKRFLKPVHSICFRINWRTCWNVWLDLHSTKVLIHNLFPKDSQSAGPCTTFWELQL